MFVSIEGKVLCVIVGKILSICVVVDDEKLNEI